MRNKRQYLCKILRGKQGILWEMCKWPIEAHVFPSWPNFTSPPLHIPMHPPFLPQWLPCTTARYRFRCNCLFFCFILFCFFKFNLGLLKSFLELSSSIVFIFSVWLAELDFCCKYMHFKFKEAMNRKRCQIKSILLYNSSIEGNIKVENIDTTAWVMTVLIIPAAQCLRVDFSKYTHEGLGCWCLYNEKSNGIFTLSH